MPLMECRLCKKIFTEGGRNNICPQCIRRLGDLYSAVHKYMRDNEDREFDVDKLADEMEISPLDVQALVDLGYIERDIGLYGKRETARSKLAHAFGNELEKMSRNKITTYGGEIYARGYDREEKEDNIRTVRKR